MEQHGLPRFDLVRAADQILHGEALEHHGSSVLIGNALGDLDQPVRGHQPHFGIGARRPARVGNAIAGLDPSDVGANRLDHARALEAKPAGKRKWIQAGAMIGVDEIEPDGGVFDARLVRAGVADGHVLVNENLGTAGLVEANCLRHDPLLYIFMMFARRPAGKLRVPVLATQLYFCKHVPIADRPAFFVIVRTTPALQRRTLDYGLTKGKIVLQRLGLESGNPVRRDSIHLHCIRGVCDRECLGPRLRRRRRRTTWMRCSRSRRWISAASAVLPRSNA